jgi:prepilin-type N-terminal cleavage/methylation domain-containing protein
MRTTTQRGFTLIELMIVVAVIGILAAIAIPNYIALERRAGEAQVKANMHTLQLVMEDFSVQNNGFYATTSSSTTTDGRTLAQACPSGQYPQNPFTKLPSTVQFNANPSVGSPGELGFNPALPGAYMLKGNGPLGDSLSLVLTTGQ